MNEPESTRASVQSLLDDAVLDCPDKEFVLDQKEGLTYRETRHIVRCIAQSLLNLGIEPGDRVLVSLPNSVDYVVAWFGCALAGAIVVPVDANTPLPELERLADRVNPKLLVSTSPSTTGWLEQRCRRIGPAMLRDGPSEYDGLRSADEGVFVMISTSGTTSEPKLVMQTQQAYLLTAESVPSWFGLTSADRLMVVMPLFHLNAQLYSVLGAMAARATACIAPRFSATTFWEQARAFSATQFNCVAPIPEMLLRQPRSDSDRDHSVRLMYTAPSMPAEQEEQFEKRFGVQVVTGYGMSESPFGMLCPIGSRPGVGAIGRPRQHPVLGIVNHVRIVDENNLPVAPGEVGELLLSNPTIMKGYYGMPEATTQVLRDGWFHTGDLVRSGDNGMFFYVGRRNDVFRSRGHNITPNEIELVLSSHPHVLDCAVVGLPSELDDIDVTAFIVLSNTIDLEELKEWCRERLAPYKVPRAFHIRSDLPKTATGRVIKRQLAAVL